MNYWYDQSKQLMANFSDTTKLTSISKVAQNVYYFYRMFISDSPLDFNTTVGTLVGLFNSTLSSSISPNLLGMFATDYLMCFIIGAPWSISNTAT
jgi:hypothetical protein